MLVKRRVFSINRKFWFCRYYNVITYDHSRVIVQHDDKEIYINASVVKVPQANREYILSQGKETVGSNLF